THYFLPQTNSSKAIFTLVQSPAFIPEIRKRTADKEETITKIGYQLTPYFHVNDQFMVWDELRKDARFGKQTYNIIRILDLSAGEIEDLSKNSRVDSPIVSDNCNKVYTVQVEQINLSSLFYIDRMSKKSSEIKDLPAGFLIRQPSLNADDPKISAIANRPKG